MRESSSGLLASVVGEDPGGGRGDENKEAEAEAAVVVTVVAAETEAKVEAETVVTGRKEELLPRACALERLPLEETVTNPPPEKGARG